MLLRRLAMTASAWRPCGVGGVAASRWAARGRRPRAAGTARCLSSMHDICDELEDTRAQVGSLPEAQAAAALQRDGKHRAAVESLERVVDIMRAVPDPSFQQVALELLCRAALLRGNIPQFAPELAAYASAATGGDPPPQASLAHPRALLRSTNLAALLMLRQGDNLDALSLLQETKSAVDAWVGDGNGNAAQDPSFAALRALLSIQLGAAALTQGVVEPSTNRLSAVVDVGSGSDSTAEATVHQLAILHLRRAQLHACSTSGAGGPIVGLPHRDAAAAPSVPDAEAVAAVDAAATAARDACASLPLGRVLEAIHRLQLAEALRGGRAADMDAMLSSAVALSDAPPGLPYTAAAPLRALGHVFEATGDITTAEALHTGNADNLSAWMLRDPKQGTWSALVNAGDDRDSASGAAVIVSDTSVAEEFLRSIRARASLVGRLEWNGKRRTAEERGLLDAARAVVKRFPELKATDAAAAATCGGADSGGAAGADPSAAAAPSPTAGEVADVRVLPSWHFDVCYSVLFA